MVLQQERGVLRAREVRARVRVKRVAQVRQLRRRGARQLGAELSAGEDAVEPRRRRHENAMREVPPELRRARDRSGTARGVPSGAGTAAPRPSRSSRRPYPRPPIAPPIGIEGDPPPTRRPRSRPTYPVTDDGSIEFDPERTSRAGRRRSSPSRSRFRHPRGAAAGEPTDRSPSTEPPSSNSPSSGTASLVGRRVLVLLRSPRVRRVPSDRPAPVELGVNCTRVEYPPVSWRRAARGQVPRAPPTPPMASPYKGHLRGILFLSRSCSRWATCAGAGGGSSGCARCDGDASAEVDEGDKRDGSRVRSAQLASGERAPGIPACGISREAARDDRRARCPRAHRRDGGTWGERRERG